MTPAERRALVRKFEALLDRSLKLAADLSEVGDYPRSKDLIDVANALQKKIDGHKGVIAKKT